MRKLLHRFEFRVALLAAMALLFAQGGAMSHAYSHNGAVGSSSLSHQAGSLSIAHQLGSPASAHQAGSPSAEQQKAAANRDLCNDCLAYAPLLCVAGTSAALPFIETRGLGLTARSTADFLVPPDLRLAFRPRAPPRML